MSGEPRRLGANLSVRLTAEYLEAIDELAAAEGRSRTEMLRVLLSDGLLVHRKRISADGQSISPRDWTR